jgi:uncharacterized protein (DUF169 family)
MVDEKSRYDLLNELLYLPTPPVAIKYFSSFNEDLQWELADLGFYRPKNPINVCQCVGLARHHKRKILVVGEDMACNVGALAVGMHPFDETMETGEIGIRDGVRETPDCCKELFGSLPRIDYGEVKAVACAPLDEMDLDYDQVVFYGTPLEMLKIRLDFSTCAKYGVCVEGMAGSYVSGKPTLGFPCRGERVSSIVQEHEIFVCVAVEQIDDVIEGLEKTKHLLPTPMPFSGVDQEPTFLPDYYLTETAKARRDRARAST